MFQDEFDSLNEGYFFYFLINYPTNNLLIRLKIFYSMKSFTI